MNPINRREAIEMLLAGSVTSAVADWIKARYGTVETWAHDFRVSGVSLAGGSGRMILNDNPHERCRAI